ncbi:SGNH/GDSL hydrolase family protein [Streptococcus suis]|uniref:SGNH/GDSL hydrolase family protein n=1 Tax=Streptococcus suis TaxID=1307 RepID=UPI000CF5B4BA|nr:SGNH/GDSL hydrolase family protein [Streptococcus suis]HEM2809634.1 SGNH/GDSL hydrolase family protein [Streptococcus suis]
MNNRKLIQGFVYFFLCLLTSILLFHHFIPAAPSLLTDKETSSNERTKLTYIALGDSLTEGVGDTTGQGGFVPLLAQSLVNDYGYEVDFKNFGVSGNTSNQILKRMSEDESIKDYLKKADFMTLTVGGNDLRKVILSNFSNLKISTFVKPAKDYSKRLETIIQTAHQANPNLPIYVVGIYNPFYISFPEMTEMQTIVDNWNQTTEQVTQKFKNVYFVPINDLLYKGLDGESGVSQVSGQSGNNLLYEEDNFHPNNTGYEMIKKAVMEEMNETKESWQNQ